MPLFRSKTRFALLLTSATLAITTIVARAEARPPWPRVAQQADGTCDLQVRGNGKFFKIAVRGLYPSETARFELTNEDMTPIRFVLKADDSGEWTKYYLPFLWHHRSGTVGISVEGEECALNTAFSWTRDMEY